MKKILILFAAIFLSIGAYSQDLNKTNLRMMVDKINTKADIDDGTHTGTTEMEDLSITGSISTPTSITTSSISTDALQVGDSANVVSIDDITRIGDSFRIYDDGVQLAPDIPVGGYAELGDYAVMIDTGIKFVAPYGMIPPSSTASDATSVNYVYVTKFYLPYRMIVNHIGVGITTESANDSINVGIYNSAGTIKLIDSGILSSTATGYVSSVVAGVTLGPGFYWSAYSNSNNAIRVKAVINDGISGMGSDAYVRGRGSNLTYKGVLPTTLGTISQSSHNYHLIVLTNY